MLNRTPIKWFGQSAPWHYGITYKRLRQDFMEGRYRPGLLPVALDGEFVRVRVEQPASFQFMGVRGSDAGALRSVLPEEVQNQWSQFRQTGSWGRLLANKLPAIAALEYRRQQIPWGFGLHEKISRLQQSAATAGQWRKTLDNLDGVSAWERHWSGLWDWLDERPPDEKIDRAQLLQRAHFRCVKPRFLVNWTTNGTTELGFDKVDRAPTLKQKMQLRRDGAWGRIVLRNRSVGYQIAQVNRPDLFEGTLTYWQAFSRTGRLLKSARRRRFESARSAVEYCWKDAARAHRLRGANRAAGNWSRYATATNEYQETLVTLPGFPADMERGHFKCRNVLLFVRTTVAYTKNGQRVLLLEEIQSDWLQHPTQRKLNWIVGRRRSELPVPWQKSWARIGCQLALYLAAEKNCTCLAWSDWNLLFDRYGEHAETDNMVRFYDRTLPKQFKRLAQSPVERRTLLIDKDYMVVKTADGLALVDDNGQPLTESVCSPDELTQQAIGKGLMGEVDLPSVKISEKIAAQVLAMGLTL